MAEDEGKPASVGWTSRLSEINVLVWVPLLLCFWIFIQLSLIIYSVYFGPLSDIPGPKIAALTHLYESYSAGYRPEFYWRDVQELHKRYGLIVRISPNEIHLDDVAFAKAIYPSIEDLDRDSKSGGLLLRRGSRGSEVRRVRKRVGVDVSPRSTRKNGASHFSEAELDIETLWHVMREPSRRSEAIPSTVVSKAQAKNNGAVTDEIASVIGNALYYGFSDQDLSQRIETKMSSAALADHESLDYEERGQLPYLSAVMSELLRLSISTCTTEITTVLDRDMVYKDVIIPAGVTVSMNLEDLHSDQQCLLASASFDPEIWIRPEMISNREKLSPEYCLDVMDMDYEFLPCRGETFAKRKRSRTVYRCLPLIFRALITHFNVELVEMRDEREGPYEETHLFLHSGVGTVGLRVSKKES